MNLVWDIQMKIYSRCQDKRIVNFYRFLGKIYDIFYVNVLAYILIIYILGLYNFFKKRNI